MKLKFPFLVLKHRIKIVGLDFKNNKVFVALDEVQNRGFVAVFMLLEMRRLNKL